MSKIKRVRVYEDDWAWLERNFSGSNSAEKFHRLVENVNKLLEMVEMYKELADMYREQTIKLNAIIVRQAQEIDHLLNAQTVQRKGLLSRLKEVLFG